MAYHYYYNERMHILWDLRFYTDTLTITAGSTIDSEIVDAGGIKKVYVVWYTTLAHASSLVTASVVYIHDMEEKYIVDIGSIPTPSTNTGGAFTPFELYLDVFKLRFVNNDTVNAAQFELFVRGIR